MRLVFAALILLFGSMSSWAFADDIMNCGFKPIPDLNCRIGSCVNGRWQQVCDQAPALTCGIRPIPDMGCQIGSCVDGRWQQVCRSQPVYQQNSCCRICRTGKACGDSCIAQYKTCHQDPGCACNQ